MNIQSERERAINKIYLQAVVYAVLVVFTTLGVGRKEKKIEICFCALSYAISFREREKSF